MLGPATGRAGNTHDLYVRVPGGISGGISMATHLIVETARGVRLANLTAAKDRCLRRRRLSVSAVEAHTCIEVARSKATTRTARRILPSGIPAGAASSSSALSGEMTSPRRLLCRERLVLNGRVDQQVVHLGWCATR